MDQSIITSKINTKENRQLLRKYLYKDFIKNGSSHEEAMQRTTNLVNQYSDNLFGRNGLAHDLGAKSLEFFCMYFLQDTFVNGDDNAPIAPIHKQMWADIEGMVLRNTHAKQGYILPRGTGKSFFGNVAPVCWTHAYNYKEYSLIGSSIMSTAKKFLNNVRSSLEDNPYIEYAFGKLIGVTEDNKKLTNNSEQIRFSNGSLLEVIPSTSTMRGRNNDGTRVTALYLDDFQDDDDVRTDQARENKYKRYSDDATKALQRPTYKNNKMVKQSHIFALGTLQHPEDFYSRLLQDPTWKFRVEKGVLVDDVDEVYNEGLWGEFKKLLYSKDEDRLDKATEFYRQNKEEMDKLTPLLWDEFWDPLDFAMDYYSNPGSFQQEVQANLNSQVTKWFKSVRRESPEEIESHDFKKTMLVVDPAGTGNKNKKSKDYYAYIVGSIGENTFRYVRKGEIHKQEYNDYLTHVIKLLKAYPDIQAVAIEKNVYSGADVLKLKEMVEEDRELCDRNIEWINKHETKNKDDRIQTVVGDVNLGSIIFNENDEPAIQQLLDFAGQHNSRYDDFPDCLAAFAKQILALDDVKEVTVASLRELFGRG